MNPDPRLTAYALGELEPAEREAFERDLAASPALQGELQTLIPLCDELMKTLPEATDLLADPQRADLRARAAARPPAPSRRFLPRVGALAAGLVLAAGIFVFNRQSTPPLVARNFPAKALPQEPPAAGDAAVSPSNHTFPAPASPFEREKITQLLVEAEGFYARGSYDLSEKRPEQILALDRDNLPARTLREKNTRAKKEFDSLADNATRSRKLWSVTKGWELPVRRSSATPESKTEAVAAYPPPQIPRTLDNPGTSGAQKQLPSPVIGAADSYAQAASPALSAGVPASEPVDGSGRFPRPDDRKSRRHFPAAATAESYDAATPNAFLESRAQPLSTFSIDVDTASYANVRRFLTNGQLPPPGAVRLEELINYFPYDLPRPEGDAPFSVTTEVSRAPWNPAHLLARIALKGRDLDVEKLPASNLVFLVDVSGSMDEPDKLPLLKRSLRELVARLTANDRVAIVTYAGNSGLALPSTSGRDQARILDAIDRLEPGGSTNGAAGIELAYQQARGNFAKSGNNRVILCTDGDFNVGVTSRNELTRLIERERKSGVFLSVLGFGAGNLKDAAMENLADRGNGNYAYIDSPGEGRKVLVEQMGATLFTIAKDVKIQVEFNPATVAGYRLIGYENRLLAKEDFNDDTKDAGEIGAGHAVTALYEIVPAGENIPGLPSVDPLKYQRPAEEPKVAAAETTNSRDLFTVKLRSKAPDGDVSKLIEKVVGPDSVDFARASTDFRFATAVAAFGMKLRGGSNDATMNWNDIQRIARESMGADAGSYRAEFLVLIEKAKPLAE